MPNFETEMETETRSLIKKRLYTLTRRLALCISIQDNERVNEIMNLSGVINIDEVYNLYHETLNEIDLLMDSALGVE